jgi:chaperonin GroES
MGKPNLRVLGDRVLVKPEEQPSTAGGILIPETAKEKPQEGVVLAVGPGRRLKDGRVVKPDVEEGDRVVFAKYGGHEVEVDGEKLLILDSDQIYGKMVAD